MDYNIPPTTFLPFEEDAFSNYDSEPSKVKSFLLDAWGIFKIGLSVLTGVWIVFTILSWAAGNPYKDHKPTLKETIKSQYDFVVDLFNRKSEEELEKERIARSIKGKAITETWEGTTINGLKPFQSQLKPDSIYFEPVDLYRWYHPKYVATITLSSGTTITYNGSALQPTVAGEYKTLTSGSQTLQADFTPVNPKK